MQSLWRNTALVPFSSCPRYGSHTPLPVFGSGSPLHWPGLMAAVLPKQARSPLQELWPIFPLLPSQAMTANDIYRMVRRCLRDAGLPARQLSCHSFRATAITDLLTQGVPLEDVQYLAGHADPHATRLYDRRQKQVTRNIVERISV